MLFVAGSVCFAKGGCRHPVDEDICSEWRYPSFEQTKPARVYLTEQYKRPFIELFCFCCIDGKLFKRRDWISDVDFSLFQIVEQADLVINRGKETSSSA